MQKLPLRNRPHPASINIHIPFFKVYRNWKRVVRRHVGAASISCGILTVEILSEISVVCMVCTVCGLRFSMTVVAWMRVKAVNTIRNGFSTNEFWIHSLAGFWIPMPSIPDSTSKNFMDSGIRITWGESSVNAAFCWQMERLTVVFQRS